MTSVPSDAFHILVRALLLCTGAVLLWTAPISMAGLVLMFVGLVCAVGALTFEKTRQF
jgi:1,4-dihydroxy-2-naphthoate octaprenyltransferase